MNKKQKIEEQQQDQNQKESSIASWASKWVSDNFQVKNEDLEKAITRHCNQNSLVELKSLFDALKNQKDLATEENLNLGTIENLITLIKNKITKAEQFTPLFDALKNQKDLATGENLNLGTIENFIFLTTEGVKNGKNFQKLNKNNFKTYIKNENIPMDLRDYLEKKE